MKQWTFKAQYLVVRVCTIDAETIEDAKALWTANEWDEGHDVDCSLQDAEEPDWEEFE